MKERAILAGGCFWGMQDLSANCPACLRPVSATPAATSPTPPTATTATTPKRSRSSSTRRRSATADLLEFFFQIHDPSTPNRQGNDRGPGYRSAIFYTDERQKPWRRTRSPMWTRPASGPARWSRSWPRRTVLAGRARAPGLSRADPPRLHLPFHPPEVEAAASRSRLTPTPRRASVPGSPGRAGAPPRAHGVPERLRWWSKYRRMGWQRGRSNRMSTRASVRFDH